MNKFDVISKESYRQNAVHCRNKLSAKVRRVDGSLANRLVKNWDSGNLHYLLADGYHPPNAFYGEFRQWREYTWNRDKDNRSQIRIVWSAWWPNESRT